MLEAGGNAFDAAVAAGFAGAVVEPALTSLGGGGFLLARTAQGKMVLFDFFVNTPGKGRKPEEIESEPSFFPVTVKFPGSDQVFNIGAGSVAVPGNLKGFLHVHRLLGILPLKEVLAPAIEYAAKGTKLNRRQAYFLSLLKPIMLHSPMGKELFLIKDNNKERYVEEGDTLIFPDLAAFLEEVAASEGDAIRDIYEGMAGANTAREMEKTGGLLTQKDLREYQVIERKPLSARFKGVELHTNPPPSFGGFFIKICLELLERLPIENMDFGTAQHLSLLTGAMIQVENYREEMASRLIPPDETWFDSASQEAVRLFARGTTHVSISDSHGNCASMTTSNGEGSGCYIPGTGIMLNNMMGEDDLHPDGFHSSKPGIRVASMMSPSMVTRENQVHLVLGSGGSKRIRTAITQAFLNWAHFNIPITDAVISPRIHWDGELLQVEPGFSSAALEELSKKIRLNIWKEIDVYFGGVHAVAPLKGEAVGDPRRGGMARII